MWFLNILKQWEWLNAECWERVSLKDSWRFWCNDLWCRILKTWYWVHHRSKREKILKMINESDFTKFSSKIDDFCIKFLTWYSTHFRSFLTDIEFTFEIEDRCWFARWIDRILKDSRVRRITSMLMWWRNVESRYENFLIRYHSHFRTAFWLKY